MPENSLLPDALQKFARETPDKLPSVPETNRSPFAQLNDRAEKTGHRLKRWRCSRNAGSGLPAAAPPHSSLHCFAVLKTGAAYVPLDSIYPKRLIAGILEDVKQHSADRDCSGFASGRLPEHCLILDAVPDTSDKDSLEGVPHERWNPHPAIVWLTYFTSVLPANRRAFGYLTVRCKFPMRVCGMLRDSPARIAFSAVHYSVLRYRRA